MRHPDRAPVDLTNPIGVEIVDPDAHLLAGEGDSLGIGRPRRLVPVPGAERSHGALLSRTVGRPDRQLVLAGPVGPVRDVPAVG